MTSLIQKLVETPGPSGFETQVRALVRGEVEPLADEVRVDNLGNLIARKGKVTSNGLKIMLSAHMDELGVMVTHVDEHGFVRFAPIGTLFPKYCLSSRVRFLNGAPGVINAENPREANKTQSLDQMYIDLGASSREDCPVKVGDVGIFERPFLDLGKRLVSKALDDRISVAILIEAMRALQTQKIKSPNEVYFVFSVQEEVGTRGAMTATFGIDPDLGLAVDVTLSGDTPHGVKMEVGLGKGPAIKVRDSGMLSDPRVVRWMVDTAQKAGLPYQLEILEGGSTDARAMQTTRSGIPAGCLSIPLRYVHSPSEMVDFDDVQHAVRLLVELLRDPVKLE